LQQLQASNNTTSFPGGAAAVGQQLQAAQSTLRSVVDEYTTLEQEAKEKEQRLDQLRRARAHPRRGSGGGRGATSVEGQEGGSAAGHGSHGHSAAAWQRVAEEAKARAAAAEASLAAFRAAGAAELGAARLRADAERARHSREVEDAAKVLAVLQARVEALEEAATSAAVVQPAAVQGARRSQGAGVGWR
jgi:chromosome segregation ATPase